VRGGIGAKMEVNKGKGGWGRRKVSGVDYWKGRGVGRVFKEEEAKGGGDGGKEGGGGQEGGREVVGVRVGKCRGGGRVGKEGVGEQRWLVF